MASGVSKLGHQDAMISGVMRMYRSGRRLTAFVQLPLENLDHRFGMSLALCVLPHNLPELFQTAIEWHKVCFVIDRGFIHVV
jgi:predicted TIM-barrel fold metal-dependent hydrolase